MSEAPDKIYMAIEDIEWNENITWYTPEFHHKFNLGDIEYIRADLFSADEIAEALSGKKWVAIVCQKVSDE